MTGTAMTGAAGTAPTILLVEDDENLRVALADNLEQEGYRVLAAADGASARARLAEGAVDVVVLDIMLPDTDGYTLCRRILEHAPRPRILMLTARSLEDDLVRGFEVGADDYLTKPYRLRELLARVAALLRRDGRGLAAGTASGPLALPGFRLDAAARTLHDDAGHEVTLTRTEFDLLVFLVGSAGRALTRDAILDAVWGRDVLVDERTVDNFVSSLKRKLGWSAEAPFRIQTVRGVGYRMEIDGFTPR